MKFWRWLAWLCSAAFLAMVLISWMLNAPHAPADAAAQQEPPPAPVFH